MSLLHSLLSKLFKVRQRQPNMEPKFPGREEERDDGLLVKILYIFQRLILS